jgi:uncharacterized protein (TIGR03067 family)
VWLRYPITLAILITWFFVFTETALSEEPERNAVRGAWKILEITNNGNPVGRDDFQGTFLVFSRKDLLTRIRENGEVETQYTIRLLPNSSPLAIDFARLGSRTKKPSFCIYKIEGDILTICASEEGADKRPTTFESVNGSHLQLIKLTRVKK